MAINRIATKAFYSLIGALAARRDRRDVTSKWFPTCQGTNYLYAPLLADASGEAYFTKYYSEKPNNPLAVNFKRYKTDIVKGRLFRAGTPATMRIEVPSAIPYAVISPDVTTQEGDFSAQVHVNDRRYDFGNLVADRFYYLPIREKASIEFRSIWDLIVGRPLPLIQDKKHPVRFVLVLFVDNFGWDIVNRIDFARDLPNIHCFFGRGTIFDRCYASSNWTLPGVGTLMSGRSLASHRMFHPSRDVRLGDGYPVLPEYFQNDGYLTFQVCGNTRKSPAYGYVKGFDRTVYKNEMSLIETIGALMDHLRAFPERDHFAWMTMLDAHHTLAGTPDIANQLAVPLVGHDYREERAKSPMMLQANEGQTLRHIEELKRIDFNLGPVFRFIEERYADDEMLVCLVADHGPGFTTADPRALSHEKTHVALMMRGRGVGSAARIDEPVQNTDVFPTLLHLAGLAYSENIDGRLPECLGGPPRREYAISEIMYPGKKYEATIKDARFEFYLTSNGPVDDDGRFTLDPPGATLHPLGDWTTDATGSHPDRVAFYTDLVRRHLGRERVTGRGPGVDQNRR